MAAVGRKRLLVAAVSQVPLPARKQPFASHHFKGRGVPLSANGGPIEALFPKTSDQCQQRLVTTSTDSEEKT